MNPQDTIRQALVEELEIVSMPKELQDEAIAAAGGPILQSVMIDILEKLPPAQRDAFQKALEAGDQKSIEALITANIPDPATFIGQSVEKAIAEFKSLRKA